MIIQNVSSDMKVVVLYLSRCIKLSPVPHGELASDFEVTKTFFDALVTLAIARCETNCSLSNQFQGSNYLLFK